MIFGNVDVSLREALDKGWQNGGKRWETGGKRWQTGVINTVVENKKGLLYYEYGVFLYREQVITQRTKSF